MNQIVFKILGISLLLMPLACSNSNDEGSSISGNLELSLNGIEPTVGQHYEGWIIAGGEALSSGRFNVKTNGDIVSVDVDGNELSTLGNGTSVFFNYEENGASEVEFVLTIEPNGDTDPGPSAIHLVSGVFNNAEAIAVTDRSSAIGASFLGSTGTYILATPTTSSVTTDENQGVWFLSAGAPSLDLPLLGPGWAYEGWVVDTALGTPISTGIFFEPSGADSDFAGPAAGSDSAPSFPGQDFINPARVLNNGDHRVVITVEPYPDADPAPFTLKILAHDIANGQIAGASNDVNLNNISNEESIIINAFLR